ncbi:hypothetical protein IFM89_038141 [Coptis chinensis]|uniref:protein-disulfide reductase n=1 Tax=Coptis chinensis TaxID=261450 RepID=A0A835HVE4_9MAGN|nr:hypothetical protein IFM89_038141 [Coptis chinensis]
MPIPWLAIPCTDSETCEQLKKLFRVSVTPCLTLLDRSGKVMSDNGAHQYFELEMDVYMDQAQNYFVEHVVTERMPMLGFILNWSRSRTSFGRSSVPVSELKGKIVGLYFASALYSPCDVFTQKLVEVYNKLKEGEESFEVVLICLEEKSKEPFEKIFRGMPWLSLPFKDERCGKLIRYFGLIAVPTLVILGPDGKTLHPNAAELVEDYGTQAYPFTAEKMVELEEINEARLKAQTLESVLVEGERDFVLGKDGIKIPVSQLVGKNILLYFSAHWSIPCRNFLPELIKAYHDIKAKDEGFEVIFISRDRDESSFQSFFSGMPWLTLPFGDERIVSLSRAFKICGLPTAIALGPSRQTVTKDARELLTKYGATAYPFLGDRL